MRYVVLLLLLAGCIPRGTGNRDPVPPFQPTPTNAIQNNAVIQPARSQTITTCTKQADGSVTCVTP
jgi:hypothetical protein